MCEQRLSYVVTQPSNSIELACVLYKYQIDSKYTSSFSWNLDSHLWKLFKWFSEWCSGMILESMSVALYRLLISWVSLYTVCAQLTFSHTLFLKPFWYPFGCLICRSCYRKPQDMTQSIKSPSVSTWLPLLSFTFTSAPDHAKNGVLLTYLHFPVSIESKSFYMALWVMIFPPYNTFFIESFFLSIIISIKSVQKNSPFLSSTEF